MDQNQTKMSNSKFTKLDKNSIDHLICFTNFFHSLELGFKNKKDEALLKLNTYIKINNLLLLIDEIPYEWINHILL